MFNRSVCRATGSALAVTGLCIAGVVVSTPSPAAASGPAPVVTSVSPSSGPAAGGNTITILGSNFRNLTAVSVGSVALSPEQMFITQMGTKITVKAPAESDGTVDVTVMNDAGTSPMVSADEYTYLGPTVLGISRHSGPGNGGTKVTITGDDLRGATAVTFGGTEATNFAMNAAKTLITATAPAELAGTVAVQVTTPGGISSDTPADAYTFLAPTITRVSPNHGPGGGDTKVIIAGADLQGATSVMFGGTGATSFSVNRSGTHITAYAPGELAGTVAITVTTHGGPSSITPADEYTFLAPTVTHVNPASGSGNTVVVITGTNFQGATEVTFAGVSAAFSINPAVTYHPYGTQITATAPTGLTGPVDIVVTTPGGPSGTGSADVFTYS